MMNNRCDFYHFLSPQVREFANFLRFDWSDLIWTDFSRSIFRFKFFIIRPLATDTSIKINISQRFSRTTDRTDLSICEFIRTFWRQWNYGFEEINSLESMIFSLKTSKRQELERRNQRWALLKENKEKK